MKKTSCYDIDVEVDDPLKIQMNNFLLSTASQQEIQSLDNKIHETVETINQLNTVRHFGGGCISADDVIAYNKPSAVTIRHAASGSNPRVGRPVNGVVTYSQQVQRRACSGVQMIRTARPPRRRSCMRCCARPDSRSTRRRARSWSRASAAISAMCRSMSATRRISRRRR